MVMDLKTHHYALAFGGVIAAAGFFFLSVKLNAMAQTPAGYKAKMACSEIFVAKRNPKTVLEKDFENIDPVLDRFHVKINNRAQEVSTIGPIGLGRTKAVYREGFGCTLQKGKLAKLTAPGAIATQPWPEGNGNGYADKARIDELVEAAFADNPYNHRALIVVVNGEIVSEAYAEGFSKETPLLSWSMAKSVTATFIGAAARRGLLDVEAPAPAPEWRGDDPRRQITWNDLLHMQSGLAFDEDYENPTSDANRMLFASSDMGGHAAVQPLIHKPGEHWSYSSGTSNLLARTLRQSLDARGEDYYDFARKAVFEPIGAASMVMEPDPSGTQVGSSYIYGTARDWARLGQLYLQDGVWDGQRLLPEGWADYVSTPAAASDRQYGAHFWLNYEGEEGRERIFAGVPEEAYFMAGHEGQYVLIIPEKNMVIFRAGATRGAYAGKVIAPLLAAIYESVARAAPASQ